MRIEIPELSLIAMIGSTSSGKTSFANRYFKPTEVLSSDFFRAMVSDDENNLDCSQDAFDLLYHAAEIRLTNGKLTVIDATNLQQSARKKVLDLAKKQNVHAAAVVLNLPESILLERNQARENRGYPERVIKKHCQDLKRSIRNLKREGFRFVYVLNSLDDIDHAEIIRTKLWNDRKDMHDPVDVIGDIHGCYDELVMLLEKLGYQEIDGIYQHPAGRKAAFLGDFCDRGDQNVNVLKLVMKMVRSGNALAVPGNHDMKLLKYLRGKQVQLTHGLDKTIAELSQESEDFRAEVAGFLDKLISHYVLDDGKLVIAHAGLREEYIGRGSGKVRDFCLYGETTGEMDEYGLPVRLNWAADYRGRAVVVYGHISQKEVQAVNHTYCIDTGCVFGGKLTAFRWPEKECISVDALKEYYAPVRPLDEKKEAESMGDLLTIGEYQGKLYLHTDLIPGIQIQENHAAAALEIMSRFAADPHWLIYLPPTMSPCRTSELQDYLEHPLEAFEYYHKKGVEYVICEKKHMGSRAVMILCHTLATAENRFGVKDGTRGIIYTRTGRRFFDQPEIEKILLDRLDAVLTRNHFWEEFNTDWICLDAELMPWSEKAQVLLKNQYAPVSAAGSQSLAMAVEALQKTADRIQNSELLERYQKKQQDIANYAKAYREYCWTVHSPDDFRIAPFHLLACEDQVFSEQSHIWHMENIRNYIADGSDLVFMETPYLVVNTQEKDSIQKGVAWWEDLTGTGGEGMVIKPEYFTAKRQSELLQPAVKCRGREYLRMIYGAEYLSPEYLSRLKQRSLNRKRSLALKEFALGIEALHRFVKHAPLYQIHECVFGVLAFESEPVDPRL